MILTVREEDLRKIIGVRPFVALPQEEIDRHYASIEVHPVERSEAEMDVSVVQLVAMVAVHYNYSWLICTSKNDDTISNSTTLSLGLTGDIIFDGHNDIFLDESIKKTATLIVNDRIGTNSGYDLRLAGLLRDASDLFGHRCLGVVFIARLHQPGVTNKHTDVDIQFSGSGELQQHREQFDSRSRILIDHITAL